MVLEPVDRTGTSWDGSEHPGLVAALNRFQVNWAADLEDAENSLYISIDKTVGDPFCVSGPEVSEDFEFYGCMNRR